MSEFDSENIDVEGLLLEVQRLQTEQEKADAEQAAANKEYEEAERLLRQLYRQKIELQRQREARRNDLRIKEKELERAKRFADAKEERDRLFKEFEEKAKRLDELTASAKWREFAFDHQIIGAKRLGIAKRGILADKRGLGKTLTSLIWADMVQGRRILVLAPNDIVPQFEDEIREWLPGRTIFALRGLPPAQRTLIYPMLNMVPEFIITLNYEAWRKDKTIIDDLVSAGIDTIICDEAHKIKSSSKITARGVFQIAFRPNRCQSCNVVKNFLGPWTTGRGTQEDWNYLTDSSLIMKCPDCSGPLDSTVENALTMTGTPILNKPQELFSLLHIVNPLRFQTEKQFLDDYCYSYAPNRWTFRYGGQERLFKSMSEFFVQRTRDEAGITLPPPAIKIYNVIKDKIKYPKQYAAEKQLREHAALMLENGDVKSMLYILEIILRERQVMTWPAGVVLKDRDEFGNITGETRFDVEESQKLDEACDLLGDLLEEDERVIVFSKFKAPLYEMASRFNDPDHPVIVATGDQSTHLREQVVKDFDLKTAPEKPRWQAVFATFDAFATGLNLNAARHVIMLDDEWSPGMEDQAIGRIDRLNSTDQANVHIFRVANSIDDFMAGLIEEKKKLTEGFESGISAAELLDHLRGSI